MVVGGDGRAGKAERPATGAEGRAVRPCLDAVIGSMLLPAFLYGPNGSLVSRNAASDHLMVANADGEERVLALDGTDLWTIVAARTDEASPTFDVHLRLRLPDGQSIETTMMVAPMRGPGGSLGGAMIIVLNEPTGRLRASGQVVRPHDGNEFAEIVTRLGQATGASRTCLLEVDTDFRSEGRVLASWGADGTRMPVERIGLKGTPFDAFSGRRLVCIASGLVDAYPNVRIFATPRHEAYVSIALSNAAGEQIGILAGIWLEPLEDVPGTCAVFSILASEATHALVDHLRERELRESEQRYGSVFEGGAVPILLVEPTTTQVVDANAAACAFYGYARDELMTMSILQLDSLAAESAHGELQQVLEGTRSTIVSQHTLADGSVRDVEQNVGPLVVAGRRLLYCMVNDITERHSAESARERDRHGLERAVGQRTEDLLRANTEVQQASVARDMMFASLAQEMNSPLQMIMESSRSLLEGGFGDLAPEQRERIAATLEAGEKLNAFVTTLLETRRLHEGELRCEPEEFDLVGLVESVVNGLASFAQSKGLSLRLLANERPLDVETDRYKVQQVLLNLLSNAIRYTERGGVTVTVTRDNRGEILVAVADTGPGLPADRIETLFDGPEVHDPAAGIGLPASQRIAGLLGGTIKVTSASSRGSVFTLRIPDRCDSQLDSGE